jgi:chromosome segregation protein
MVRIDQVSLRQFKSFGGTISIPLEEGFTVVTGPNGSGKSNILDGILFCLGLATSRGMRAERLPDLINSALLREGRAAETEVSVRFDLGDWRPDPAEEGLEPPQEGPWIHPGQSSWTVSRRLRVAPGGTYSSTYAAEGVPCTLPQLQGQLRRLRVDPEGSNVVMQGDVTRIVSMSARDRRGLIDELAGVALFDARIEQTGRKLDDVQERQERCRIVEQELLAGRQRLERDCARARSYQALREQLQEGRRQERLLAYEEACRDLARLEERRQAIGLRRRELATGLETRGRDLAAAEERLHGLQEEVRALGEDRLLAVQAELAGLEARGRELQRQAEQQQQAAGALERERQAAAARQAELRERRRRLESVDDAPALAGAEARCRAAEAGVDLARRRLAEVAGRSGSWLEEARRRSERRRDLTGRIEPLQREGERLGERLRQERDRLEELLAGDQEQQGRHAAVGERLQAIDRALAEAGDALSGHRGRLQEAAEGLSLQQRTRRRLEQEQHDLEQRIARAESRRATLQEQRGTGALRMLLASGLEGVHGPVAQLGEVEERLRLALEVAAGGRLGQVVVDDDGIAARAIDLLKRRRAGRLTFLPLNRLRPRSGSGALSRGRPPGGGAGLVGRAVDLIRCEPTYAVVFEHVFGDTLVFEDLASARRELGRVRAVTLEGDLLERSGAMTGGSMAPRGDRLGFGAMQEEDAAAPLRRRLLDLGETLAASHRQEASLTRTIEEQRPRLEELERRRAGLQAERGALEREDAPLRRRREELEQRRAALDESRRSGEHRQGEIVALLTPLLAELEALEQQEQDERRSGRGDHWRDLQSAMEAADRELEQARAGLSELQAGRRERQLALEACAEQEQEQQRQAERIARAGEELADGQRRWRGEQEQIAQRHAALQTLQTQLQERFGEQRRARDAAEAHLAGLRQEQQQAEWTLARLDEEDAGLVEEHRGRSQRLREQEADLPDPRPVIPDERRERGLAALVEELAQLQRRMEALEPVNMLALQELEELDARLAGLAERLEVLASEREELMLRIETVATLRQEAFMEAFRAVDGHFREIFGALSDGDGHLQLESPEDPLAGGLTLVAHPRGKAVRRLAAMSGGEKSLTALSFLFALQRFRPSPFYALDEVDSFLDGVNVERLADLIHRQAEGAQFLVVSHRRPMIAAAHRTIGVTQARGAHTQVVGLPAAA